MFRHLNVFLRHRASAANGMVFAGCGFVFGTWASMIPYVKEKLGLDEAGLGLLLLCMPLGTVIANALSVRVMASRGASATSWMALSAMGISFSFPVILPDVWWVGAGLSIAGGTFALTNIAMNTTATHIEDTGGIRIMAALHGMWSAGATIGALIAGPVILMLRQILPAGYEAHDIYMVIMVVSVFYLARRAGQGLPEMEGTQPQEQSPEKSKFIYRPSRSLWILIAICLCTFLTEGTMADWSAVYLRDMIRAPEAVVGWGFGVYAFCMATGRFAGDGLIHRYGDHRILRACSVLVMAGLAIIIASPNVWMALPGFMLTGLGISLASPILYAAASRMPDMPLGAGLATLNTFSMVSFLGGPVLIGLVGSVFDLRVAFGIVAFGAFIWLCLTYILKNRHSM